MNLTDELKDKEEVVETSEEKDTVLQTEAGMELSDDVLEIVAGGKAPAIKAPHVPKKPRLQN